MNGQYAHTDYGFANRNSHYPYALAADQRRSYSTRTEGTSTSDGRWMVGGFNLNDDTDLAFFWAAKLAAENISLGAAKQKKR